MPTVTLTWDDINDNEDGFNIYRDTVPLDTANPENLPTPLATVAAGIDTYDDTSAAADTTYYYAVAAYKGSFVNAAAEVQVDTAVPLPGGEIVLYTMDNVSGGTLIDEKGFRDGAFNENRVTFVPGVQGDAIHFDVSDPAQVLVSPAPVSMSTGYSFTVSAWVDLPATLPEGEDSAVLFSQNPGSGSNGFLTLYASTLYGSASGGVRAWSSDSGEMAVGPDIRGNGFTHLALVKDLSAGEVRLYVSGVLEATHQGGPGAVSDNEMQIGSQGIGDHNTLSIDQFRVYDRALSAAEVAQLANEFGN